MRFTLVTSLLIASCLPAMAQLSSTLHLLTPQGNIASVRGRAHVIEGAQGTYIEVGTPGSLRSVTGFIPFGNEPTFRNLPNIEGRTVQIDGVVVLDGRPVIVMSDPDQLVVVD